MTSDDDFDKALSDIAEWMRDSGAGAIVDNLAPGASEDAIRAVEQQLGKPFPPPLRRLYGLHDGQKHRDEHPFFEAGRLCDLEYGSIIRDRMLDTLWHEGQSGRPEDVAHVMEDSAEPLRENECTSAWWPLIDFEGAYLAVNLDTGRVFEVVEDGPEIRWRADDVAALLCEYADGAWNDLYVVAGDTSLGGVTTEGFTSMRRHLQRA